MRAERWRVLVLEPHGFQRAVAVRTFKHLGCATVLQATLASEALTLLRQVGGVDLVACGLRDDDPDMDGLEFIHWIGRDGLAKGVLVSGRLGSSLRRGLQSMVEQLGMRFFGDVEPPLPLDPLRQWLNMPLLPVTAPAPPERLWPDEGQIRGALREHQFAACYFPVFELATGRIESVELVMRWHHPLLGALAPDLFLPVVERCGLFDDLWMDTLEQGLALYQRLRDEGHTLPLSIRILTTQLGDRQFCVRVRTLMQRYGCSHEHLCLDLAGQGLYQLTVIEHENLLRLRLMGCELGLAGFGSGKGSSQLLCQLPFTRIRLDEQFIEGLPHEARCRAVVHHCLRLAVELQQRLTAVGVSTAEQHLALLTLGCESAQGAYLAPPLDREELLRRVRCERRTGPDRD